MKQNSKSQAGTKADSSTKDEATSVRQHRSKPNVISSGIVVKYDDRKLKLTKGYVDAVKNLMRQEILMMRKVHKDTPECWAVGVAEVTDLASAGGLQVMFGGKEDKSWLKKHGQIFIEVS
jgi:hypothetical protein